jgi:DNA invertase Pin-like site-specific DNA recombinase
MSEHNGNGKPLRFADLVRVSTEKQEQRGESLRTQRERNARNVELLGGTLVRRYGGQEHATEGWERKELLRLTEDAKKGLFDAVIIAYLDRWDRGSDEARHAREVFKRHGVKFFCDVTEIDLYNPDDEFRLDIHSAVGKWQARNSKKKSLLNRIARARRGVPATGLPFGRLWDKKAERWSLDPDKVAKVEDIARRYLAGESLPRLAKEHSLNHSFVCRTLRHGCGDTWDVHFDAPDLAISETVRMTVPRLLDEPTIKRLRQRLDAGRTHLHRPPAPKHSYLLAGHVFCAACGYALTGEHDKGRRYYRHFGNDYQGRKPCPLRPRPWVNAAALEVPVLKQLFDLVGNPAAIRRAVSAAVPDAAKALQERRRLEKELAAVAASRERLLGYIVRGSITEAQAEKQLAGLKDQERDLAGRLESLAAELEGIPDEAAVEDFAGRVERAGSSILVYNAFGFLEDAGNDQASWHRLCESLADQRDYERGGDVWPGEALGDARGLVEAVFSRPCADGRPAGVYVSPAAQGKKYRRSQWTWTVRGTLSFEAVLGDLLPENAGVPRPDHWCGTPRTPA